MNSVEYITYFHQKGVHYLVWGLIPADETNSETETVDRLELDGTVFSRWGFRLYFPEADWDDLHTCCRNWVREWQCQERCKGDEDWEGKYELCVETRMLSKTHEAYMPPTVPTYVSRMEPYPVEVSDG